MGKGENEVCGFFPQIPKNPGFGSGTVVGKLIIYCKSAPLSGGSVRSTLGFTVSAERPVTTQPSIIPKNSDGIQEESRGILYTGVGRRPVYCKRWHGLRGPLEVPSRFGGVRRLLLRYRYLRSRWQPAGVTLGK